MRLFVLASLTLSSLCAWQLPDGQALTKQSQEALQKLHSLSYKEDATVDTVIGDQHMKMTSEITRAVLNPGKMRMETHAQGMTMIIVSDGESTWMYNSLNNEYTRKSAALGAQGIIDSMGMGGMLPNMEDISMTPKTTGEETLTVDGKKHDCWVVRTDIGTMDMSQIAKGAKITGATMTTWIDKQLGIDLQSEVSMKVNMGAMSTTTSTKNVKKELEIDTPLAASLFAFTPPEGAKEVEKLSIFGGLGAMGAPPDLAGKPAPDFAAAGLDGKSYTLAGQEGKPVLLDFWATWCGPCRKAMPSVEKLYAEFKSQGLVVLGVDVGEDRETVQAFLKKTPLAYPAVFGADIVKDYHVTAFPTFVLIGADGKIADYQVGFGGEEMLRAMLEKAGLPKK